MLRKSAHKDWIH